MEKPLISILMPVKNAAPFLKECIDSIIIQTFTNWELIAINDHSSDESAEIMSKYSERDTRIKLHHNIDSGIIAALKLANSKSKGNFITRMDADDIMNPIKLSALLNQLLEKGKGWVATGCVKYFSSNKELNEGYKHYENWINSLTKKEINYTEIYKECVIPSPCWMLHKEDLEKIGGFNSAIYPEDYDLVFRLYYGGIQLIGSKDVLHLWRDYPERTSRNDPNYSNNAFPTIKTHYFLKHEYINNGDLILWGAGKKAKAIAKIFVKKNIAFKWITNNPKKIGKRIYDQEIINTKNIIINKNSQIIISIASKNFQPNFLKATNKYIYRFC